MKSQEAADERPVARMQVSPTNFILCVLDSCQSEIMLVSPKSNAVPKRDQHYFRLAAVQDTQDEVRWRKLHAPRAERPQLPVTSFGIRIEAEIGSIT